MQINPKKLQKSLEHKTKQIKELTDKMNALSDKLGVAYRKQGIFKNDTFRGVRMVCIKSRSKKKVDDDLMELSENESAEMSPRMRRAYSNINGGGGF